MIIVDGEPPSKWVDILIEKIESKFRYAKLKKSFDKLGRPRCTALNYSYGYKKSVPFKYIYTWVKFNPIYH